VLDKTEASAIDHAGFVTALCLHHLHVVVAAGEREEGPRRCSSRDVSGAMQRLMGWGMGHHQRGSLRPGSAGVSGGGQGAGRWREWQRVGGRAGWSCCSHMRGLWRQTGGLPCQIWGVMNTVHTGALLCFYPASWQRHVRLACVSCTALVQSEGAVDMARVQAGAAVAS
jgi:hypothetical protein